MRPGLSDTSGRMLSLIHAHLKPRATSLLFLVLPLPCPSNSRFMSIASLRNLMAAVGFELVRERWKKDGRLGYWLWQWRDAKPEYRSHWEKRIMEEDGPNRNNFSILLSRDRHIAQSPCQITCP